VLRKISILALPHLALAAAAFIPSAAASWGLAALWAAAQGAVFSHWFGSRSSLFGHDGWRAMPQPRLALTFDDGPHPEDTPAILDILGRDGAQATFFVVGERARRHPELVRRAAEQGHEIAVHSDTHPWWFSLAGRGRVRREVEAARVTVEALSGSRPRFFRPPMGHKNLFLEEALEAADLEMITWTARCFDTLPGSASRIRRAAAAGATPGGILLLHEGVRRRPGASSPVVQALPGILSALRQRGLQPSRLADLRRPAPPSRTTHRRS
jgi:peptidoglycan/xylan/chitin deacetylase (PgdA/CDA1 family)